MTGASPATIAYWALAVVSGVIVGTDVIPYPVDIILLLGLGLAATMIRRRTVGSDSAGTSLRWLLVFALAWLPIAFVRHDFPFGRG